MWQNGVPATAGARWSSARAREVHVVDLNVEIPEVQAAHETTTDDIQQAQLVENVEIPEQAARHSACALTGRSMPTRAGLPVTQVHVGEETVENTVEILQVYTTRCGDS